MLKMVPGERISAHDALQHPYFSILPPPIMHLRDSKSNPEVYLPTIKLAVATIKARSFRWSAVPSYREDAT